MLGLIALAIASIAPVPAVTATVNPDQIIVEGSRQRDKAIHDFISAVTPAPIGGQLRRFQTAVCPAAAGLPEAQALLVAERMAQVARAVGIHVAAKGCGPNVLVIVVDDKKQFITELKRRYRAYFSDLLYGYKMPPSEAGPAIAWHVEGMLTANHTPAAINSIYHYYMTSSTDSSRLRPASIPHFVAGIVAVERRALSGLTTTQLADYAAMRLYATTDPRLLKPTASTILGVLDAPMGSSIPLTLTNWDMSFLKGLYGTDDRQYANRQRNQIERMVARDERVKPGQ